MAKCKRCNRRGLFLKLNRDGLCGQCCKMTNVETVTAISADITPKDQIGHDEPMNQQITTEVVEPLLSVHPDLEGLIWFADGPLKNYYAPEGNHISVFISDTEPSAIQTSLSIVLPKDGAPVESLGYYPSYARMSPEQRGRYLLFLSNPYQEIDIGYVFVLYYGLERHLMYGDYERAFDVILKLRNVHRNVSFQHYSASALIYTAMHRKSPALYGRFAQSVDKPFEEEIPLDLLLFTKTVFGIDIQPSELIKHAGRLGFTNKRYITTEHDTFLRELTTVLTEKYGHPAMPIHLLDLSVLPTQSMPMFANGSIGKLADDLPNISEAYAFLSITSGVLQEAHNRVKELKRKKKTN